MDVAKYMNSRTKMLHTRCKRFTARVDTRMSLVEDPVRWPMRKPLGCKESASQYIDTACVKPILQDVNVFWDGVRDSWDKEVQS